MATPTFIPGRKTISIKYGANCFLCQTALFPGDLAFYPPGLESLVGDECCGDKAIEEMLPSSRSFEDDMPAMEQNVPLELVMPRGRSKADMCTRCWQIPSSSGACGCDA